MKPGLRPSVIAAVLPDWGIKNYTDYEYVVARRVGKGGATSTRSWRK
jgi:hypothetical protein